MFSGGGCNYGTRIILPPVVVSVHSFPIIFMHSSSKQVTLSSLFSPTFLLHRRKEGGTNRERG